MSLTEVLKKEKEPEKKVKEKADYYKKLHEVNEMMNGV